MPVKPQNQCCGNTMEMLPIYREPNQALSKEDEPCCGPPSGPPSSPHERPGYTLCEFVEGFIETAAGPVPRLKRNLSRRDRLGTVRVRIGIGRNDYTVAPGLYAVGAADAGSPVLVTANYKLSFDHLRSRIGDVAAWVLVLDTRGINVWCAAGKGTFGTQELIRQVWRTGLDKVVNHRRLIVPQLGATGVAAHKVKKGCGFEVVWGPVMVSDLPAFLEAGSKATAAQRSVTFTLIERLVLVPVELYLARKHFLWAVLAALVLSGIGRNIFSITGALERGLIMAVALLVGLIAGAVAAPLLLPWIPGRAFALKGAITGLCGGALLLFAIWPGPIFPFMTATALLLICLAVSSYLTMNFTGATPFTSPSGVEKEMRRAIPLQMSAGIVGVGLWIVSAFVG
jgi:hypothetical protein